VLKRYKVADTGELGPTEKMWADFTLSAADRGFTAVGMLGGPPALKNKRVLDVGCGYGGFLVAAGRAGAREVVGIDTNPTVLALAPLLLSDYSVEARLESANLIEPSLPNRLGFFDVIICNDVLEHVTSVDGAIVNLAAMLAPGGRIFLEIPNGNSINYVRSDGHYKIPGITLLDFEDARRLHAERFPGASAYDTYFYGTLDYYLAAFSRHGILLRMLDVPFAGEGSVERLEEDLAALRNESRGWVGRSRERVDAYLDEVQRRLDRYDGLADPNEREIVATSLRVDYEIGNWVLEGYRR
jgi:SAM-dependent methyltransferase